MVCSIEVCLSVLDRDRLGEFIGQKGVNIKAIERMYNVIIRLHADKPGDITATVTGEEFAVRYAELDLLASAVSIRGRQMIHTTSIPNSRIGFIIGKNGSFFRQIRDRCDVRLYIDKENEAATDYETEEDKDPNAMTTLRIQGTFEGIRLACNMLYDRLSGFGKERNREEKMKSTPHFMEDWGELNDEKID